MFYEAINPVGSQKGGVASDVLRICISVGKLVYAY
jgi:hypothetical protein